MDALDGWLHVRKQGRNLRRQNYQIIPIVRSEARKTRSLLVRSCTRMNSVLCHCHNAKHLHLWNLASSMCVGSEALCELSPRLKVKEQLWATADLSAHKGGTGSTYSENKAQSLLLLPCIRHPHVFQPSRYLESLCHILVPGYWRHESSRDRPTSTSAWLPARISFPSPDNAKVASCQTHLCCRNTLPAPSVPAQTCSAQSL